MSSTQTLSVLSLQPFTFLLFAGFAGDLGEVVHQIVHQFVHRLTTKRRSCWQANTVAITYSSVANPCLIIFQGTLSEMPTYQELARRSGSRRNRLHCDHETCGDLRSRRRGEIDTCGAPRRNHWTSRDRAGQGLLGTRPCHNTSQSVGGHSREASLRRGMDHGWRPGTPRCCGGSAACGRYDHLFGLLACSLRMESDKTFARAR